MKACLGVHGFNGLEFKVPPDHMAVHESPAGPFRRLLQFSNLVVIGAIADIAQTSSIGRE